MYKKGDENGSCIVAESQNNPERISTIGQIRSLVAKLWLCADPIDVTEFFGSQSWRKEQYFKDGEMTVSALMKFDLKIGDKNLGFLSVVFLLDLKHPCVGTAASVAVIRSLDRSFTSSLPMNRYFRHYLESGGSSNAGVRHSAWVGLEHNKKDEVTKDLKRDQNKLDSIRLKHPALEKAGNELTDVLLKLKLGDVNFVTSSRK